MIAVVFLGGSGLIGFLDCLLDGFLGFINFLRGFNLCCVGLLLDLGHVLLRKLLGCLSQLLGHKFGIVIIDGRLSLSRLLGEFLRLASSVQCRLLGFGTVLLPLGRCGLGFFGCLGFLL